jgi:hypothetical protein
VARIDHVVIGVQNLERAAAMMLDRYGLEAQIGGEHVGAGTANMVVPVGTGQFLELLAVVDATSRHPVPQALARFVADGDRLLFAAIEPDDIEVAAARVGEPILPTARQSANGHQLRWRLTGMLGALSPAALPFFVVTDEGRRWCGGDRPARHRVEPRGIALG